MYKDPLGTDVMNYTDVRDWKTFLLTNRQGMNAFFFEETMQRLERREAELEIKAPTYGSWTTQEEKVGLGTQGQERPTFGVGDVVTLQTPWGNRVVRVTELFVNEFHTPMLRGVDQAGTRYTYQVKLAHLNPA